MKNSLKYKRIYLLAALYSLISIGGTFLTMGIIYWNTGYVYRYYIPLSIFCFIFGLLAYVSGDIVYVKYRHAVQEFHPVPTKEVEERMWMWRWQFIFALILTLIVLLTFLVISLFLKRWPFL